MGKLLIFISITSVGLSLFPSASNGLELNLNFSIDPCENFYEYVCSNQIRTFQMPTGRSRYLFVATSAYEAFLNKITSFFSDLKIKTELNTNERHIRSFILSCQNVAARQEEEVKFINEVVHKLDQIRSREEFLEFTAEQVRAGYLSWVTLDRGVHGHDVNKWRLAPLVEWATMPEKSFYTNENAIRDLTNLIANLFKSLKLENPELRAHMVVELERRFAQVMLPPDQRYDRWAVSDYQPRQDFDKDFPMLSHQLGLSKTPPTATIHLIERARNRFAEEALANEPIGVLKDFALLHLISPALDFSNSDWSRSRRQFRAKYLGEAAERRSLEKECAAIALEVLDREIAFEIFPPQFKYYPRAQFKSMVTNLKTSLLNSIAKNPWLGLKSKKRTLRKINSLSLALLFPVKTEDWNLKPIPALRADEYLFNRAMIRAAFLTKIKADMHGVRNKNIWTISPLEFDAFYVHSENRFYFPAAYLQPSIYNPMESKFVTLGAVGTLIAHEMSHALDKRGVHYDYQGKLVNLLSDRDQKKFTVLEDALVTEFNEVGHDGKLTLTENMADLNGLMIGFETAFPDGRGFPKDRKLFFMSYARDWCTSMTPEYRSSHLKDDRHALPESRVNEPLKHLPQFAETYNCTPSSKMVIPSDKRIRIW